MPRKFSTRFALQVGITLGVLGVIATAIFFVGKDIRATTDQVLATRREVQSTIRQLSDLARLREEARIAEPRREVLEDALPRRDELFSFPDEIQALAAENDVSVSFAFGAEEAGSIGFSVNAFGPYGAVTRFINALEEEYLFINLSSFDIIASGNAYQGSVTGSIFFIDESE